MKQLLHTTQDIMIASYLNKQKSSAMRTMVKKCHNTPTTRSFKDVMLDPKVEWITFKVTFNKKQIVGMASCLLLTIFGGFYLIENRFNEIEKIIDDMKKDNDDCSNNWNNLNKEVVILANEIERIKMKTEYICDALEHKNKVLENENKTLVNKVYDLSNQVAWYQGFLHMKWYGK